MRKEEGAAEKLAEFVRYAIGREFPEIDGTAPLATQAIEMLRAFARRQAETVTAWVRVGYVQGNMNSDNCLLSGRTMDYGPFGFVEEYSELWTPFTSDMEAKFGFERQPLAAQVRNAPPHLHTPSPPPQPPPSQPLSPLAGERDDAGPCAHSALRR